MGPTDLLKDPYVDFEGDQDDDTVGVEDEDEDSEE